MPNLHRIAMLKAFQVLTFSAFQTLCTSNMRKLGRKPYAQTPRFALFAKVRTTASATTCETLALECGHHWQNSKRRTKHMLHPPFLKFRTAFIRRAGSDLLPNICHDGRFRCRRTNGRLESLVPCPNAQALKYVQTHLRRHRPAAQNQSPSCH